MNEGTVLVVGLGDLGTRVFQALARVRRIQRLVGTGRKEGHGRALATQSNLIADLSGGPQEVTFEPLDLEQRDATVSLLRRLDPDLIVMAASRMTWWQLPTLGGAVSLPYAAWLPVTIDLVRKLMEAIREADLGARVVCLPFPDAVGPALAPLDLAPDVGAGNVTEVASKLRVLAAREHGVPAEQVEVRLVMHHAAERLAFPAFASLEANEYQEDPPWLAHIAVQGQVLTEHTVLDIFHAPYTLPAGVATHELTAAATVHQVQALLSEEPVATHAPAPLGLPGGYPILASRRGIKLDLPPGLPVHRAVEINNRAAHWDGIDRIEAGGTVFFTAAVAEITEQALGFRLWRMTPEDQPHLAREILRRAKLRRR